MPSPSYTRVEDVYGQRKNADDGATKKLSLTSVSLSGAQPYPYALR